MKWYWYEWDKSIFFEILLLYKFISLMSSVLSYPVHVSYSLYSIICRNSTIIYICFSRVLWVLLSWIDSELVYLIASYAVRSYPWHNCYSGTSSFYRIMDGFSNFEITIIYTSIRIPVYIYTDINHWKP